MRRRTVWPGRLRPKRPGVGCNDGPLWSAGDVGVEWGIFGGGAGGGGEAWRARRASWVGDGEEGRRRRCLGRGQVCRGGFIPSRGKMGATPTSLCDAADVLVAGFGRRQ